MHVIDLDKFTLDGDDALPSSCTIQDIPLEILIHIFSYCDVIANYGTGSLPAIAGVCRYWRDAVSMTPSIWRVATLNNLKEKDFACVRAVTWLRRSCKVPLALTMDKTTFSTRLGVLVPDLVRQAETLSFTTDDVPFTTVCKTLAALHGSPNITSLKLSDTVRHITPCIWPLPTSPEDALVLPHLISLELVNTGSLSALRCPQLNSLTIGEFYLTSEDMDSIGKMRQLRRLALKDCKSEWADQPHPVVPDLFKHLEWLSVDECTMLNLPVLGELLVGAKNLKELELGSLPERPRGAINETLIPTLPQLSSLTIRTASPFASLRHSWITAYLQAAVGIKSLTIVDRNSRSSATHILSELAKQVHGGAFMVCQKLTHLKLIGVSVASKSLRDCLTARTEAMSADDTFILALTGCKGFQDAIYSHCKSYSCESLVQR
jgi:hypothetical protein